MQNQLILHIIASLFFIFIFVHLVSTTDKDPIFNKFHKYIINSNYCIILYLIINLLIYCYLDKYIGVLMFIIIISQYRTALKEFFENGSNIQSVPIYTSLPMNETEPTLPQFLRPISERNISSGSNYSFNVNDENTKNLLQQQLGIDDRFKFDEVIKDEILRQIKSQIDFDPYKSNLAKDVIYEIYNKYYDNNIFVKLKKIVDDSQDYIAAGNFTYLPKNDRVDYDLITYQNLNDNVQFGVNPIVDGIANRTRNVQR